MSHGLSEKELEALSPAEREAIEADASESEATDTSKTSVVGEDEVEDAADATDKPAADTKVDAKVEDKPAAATETVETTEAGEKEPFAVPFHHQATANADEVKTQLEALQKRYDEGELDLHSFLAERDKVMIAVTTDQVSADISEKSKDQIAAALWGRAVDDFLDGHDAYKKDDVLYDALNERVKRLASDEKNANLTDRQLLNKAHEEIAARFKVGEVVKPVDAKAALAEKRKPDLTDVPRTLANAPAAAGNDQADDEFTALDKLAGVDNIAYEQALAKMPKDKQDRYLMGSAV